MPNVKNRSSRKICEICSKLTTETPERRFFALPCVTSNFYEDLQKPDTSKRSMKVQAISLCFYELRKTQTRRILSYERIWTFRRRLSTYWKLVFWNFILFGVSPEKQYATTYKFYYQMWTALHKIWSFSLVIHRKLRIWSHLLKKSLMENFIFCAVLNADRCDPLIRSRMRIYW